MCEGGLGTEENEEEGAKKTKSYVEALSGCIDWWIRADVSGKVAGVGGRFGGFR